MNVIINKLINLILPPYLFLSILLLIRQLQRYQAQARRTAVRRQHRKGRGDVTGFMPLADKGSS